MGDQQNLLFELGTEELPPVALRHLSEALKQEFAAGLDRVSLEHEGITAYATPRRLALMVHRCATSQSGRSTRRRGPSLQAAFDADGRPTAAAEGFARSCGTTVDALQRETTEKGEWLSYSVYEAGRAAAELLPDIAEQALARLPIPRRMRWADSDAQFVRPVHWLVFMHGSAIVPCELLGVRAGARTCGHRFHSPGPVNLEHADQYESALRKARVIADFHVRRKQIYEQVHTAAQSLDGKADMDDALLDEVTALVEWPVPIIATFEERFLEVPHEALVYTMKRNQKYFPVRDNNGLLMNRFITIANIESIHPDVIRNGNERVVRPRLSDAMFFWQQDGKQRLEDHQESLKSVVFHQKLGSLYEKSLRVAGLAENIAGLIGGDADLARRAGMLSRCDLMTLMVGEFAEMQGIMGRYQALRDGEPVELADALEEFYMPRFAGDSLPHSKTGIAISLAEKLDTLCGIFGIGMKPTGDKDPFALRRAALGILRILKELSLSVDLHHLLEQATGQLSACIDNGNVSDEVYDYMLARLRGIYLDEGITPETFAAVAALRPGNIADLDRRIHAVVSFRKLPEAEALSAANKRISNILGKSGIDNPGEISVGLFEQQQEHALYAAIDGVSETVTPLMQQGQYEQALKAFAGLRGPVDAFFDEVMVMADDRAVRNNRLALLSRLDHLFSQVADLSRLSS